MAQTRLESGTNQAGKWHKLGWKMVRTRHEKSTNQARNQHEKSLNSTVLGSKLGTQNGSNQSTIEESMLQNDRQLRAQGLYKMRFPLVPITSIYGIRTLPY